MKVNKIEDSIEMITAREKPLAAYLFTNNKKVKEEFTSNVSSGSMAINETTLQVSPVPAFVMFSLLGLYT